LSEEEPSPAPGQKEKKQKKGVWRLYESKEGASKRSSRFCPRCGAGFFMANHEDRYTCGKCHYTEFKKAEKPPE